MAPSRWIEVFCFDLCCILSEKGVSSFSGRGMAKDRSSASLSSFFRFHDGRESNDNTSYRSAIHLLLLWPVQDMGMLLYCL